MKQLDKAYTSNTLTLARALLALCFLLTLVFTPLYDLFPVQHIKFLNENIHGLNHLNFFLWFSDLRIPYVFSILVLLFSVLGVYPRYLCILQSWVAYSIYFTMLVTEGGDQINVIITFLLIPVTILDNRKNGWIVNKTGEKRPNGILLYNSFLALLFIQIQIAILYFNSGVAKIYAPEWSNGTAVYYWFYDPAFGAPQWMDSTLGFLFKNQYSVSLINWGVIVLEIMLFVGLFVNQQKKYLLFLIGFFFHFLIVLVHGLPTFWISMSGCLVLYFFRLDLTVGENISQAKLALVNLKNYAKL